MRFQAEPEDKGHVTQAFEVPEGKKRCGHFIENDMEAEPDLSEPELAEKNQLLIEY